MSFQVWAVSEVVLTIFALSGLLSFPRFTFRGDLTSLAARLLRDGILGFLLERELLLVFRIRSFDLVLLRCIFQTAPI